MYDDEPRVKFENGPYVEPAPTWHDILMQGYIKSMDYFHANFKIQPKAHSWRSGIQIDEVTTHTRVVVWTHARKPMLIMAFGEERTLVKAIEPKEGQEISEANLQDYSLNIQWTVEDAEREVEVVY